MTFVGLHADGGGDVVALRLANEGIEDDAGLDALGGELLRRIDHRVLMGAVERVARLEGDGGFPSGLLQLGARLGGGEDILLDDVLLVVGEGEDVDGSADERGARVVQRDARARVVHPVGAVHLDVVVVLVPLEDVGHFEDGDGMAALIHDQGGLANLELLLLPAR